MAAIRLSRFQGEAPRISKRLLADTQAQVAFNMRLTSGRIDPVYYPKTLDLELNSALITSVFRMYNGALDYWLNWVPDVDVAKGPVAGDPNFRIYFTSDAFEPRETNLALATSAPPYPTAWYVMGVTPPTSVPGLAGVGGAGTLEDRAYVYTFVTQWGEESAPSPVSAIINGYPDATWTISGMQVAPLNVYAVSAVAWATGTLTLTVGATFGLRAGETVLLAGFDPVGLNTSWRVLAVTDSTHFTVTMADPGAIVDGVGTATRVSPHNTTGMTKRIYRSVTATSGTDYFFIGEIPVATTSYVDVAGTDIGEPVPTTGWDMPPVDLRGVRTLPSGAMVGFIRNELCYSEPLSPYAWPLIYRLTTDYPIVGIGAFESSVVVVTEGTPYVATGVDPASATLTRIDEHWPGLAKRGVVELGAGVAWPAPQGLAYAGADGVMLLTKALYTAVEWALIAPATFKATFHDNRYYAGYQISAEAWGIFVLDPEGPMTYRLSPLVAGVHTDKVTDKMYVIEDGLVKQWDADVSQRLAFEWWSKDIVTPLPVNLGMARVEGEFFTSAAEETAFNTAVGIQQGINAAAVIALTSGGSGNGASLNAYSFNGSIVLPFALVGDGLTRAVTFELYQNGALFFSKTVEQTRTFRLPAGKKYDEWSIRLLGNVPVDSVVIGQTGLELHTA